MISGSATFGGIVRAHYVAGPKLCKFGQRLSRPIIFLCFLVVGMTRFPSAIAERIKAETSVPIPADENSSTGRPRIHLKFSQIALTVFFYRKINYEKSFYLRQGNEAYNPSVDRQPLTLGFLASEIVEGSYFRLIQLMSLVIRMRAPMHIVCIQIVQIICSYKLSDNCCQ